MTSTPLRKTLLSLLGGILVCTATVLGVWSAISDSTQSNGSQFSSAAAPEPPAGNSQIVQDDGSSIEGAPIVGQDLRSNDEAWTTGGVSTTFTHEWRRCDGDGENCSAIAGADQQSYTVDIDDLGHRLRVYVTATNANGSASSLSGATLVVQGATATNITPPSISGTEVVGSTLTGDDGQWSAATSLSRQWLRCDSAAENCQPISGATDPTYVLQVDDFEARLRLRVTAQSSSDPVSATSAPTDAIESPPFSTAPPQVTGNTTAGSTLATTNGSWDGTAAISYATTWERCDASGANCQPISGATDATYVLTSTDVGSTLRSRVTATNGLGSESAVSAATDVITSVPVNLSAPSISGTMTTGYLLTADPGTWSGSPTYSYAWQRCTAPNASCSDIVDATSSSYRLVAADAGQYIRIRVTATNPNGIATASSPTGAQVAHAYHHEVAADAPAMWWKMRDAYSGCGGFCEPDVGAGGNVRTGVIARADAFDFPFPTAGGYTNPQVYNTAAAPVGSVNAAAEVWFRNPLTGSSPQALVVVGDNSAGWGLYTSNSAVNANGSCIAMVRYYVTTNVSNYCALQPNTWHHLVVNVTANVASLYIDGVYVGTLGSAGALAPFARVSAGFAFAENHATYMNQTSGSLSNVALYGAPLTTDRIQAHYAAGSTAMRASAPQNTAPPAVSPLDPEVGTTLTAAIGTWSGTGNTYAYVWQRRGGDTWETIPGANSATYTATASDLNTRLRVQVTATNAAGVRTATSPATERVVAPIVAEVAPSIGGNNSRAAGNPTFIAGDGAWRSPLTITTERQWQTCDAGDSSGSSCVDAAGQTNSTYTPASSVAAVRLKVTASAGPSTQVGYSPVTTIADGAIAPLAGVDAQVSDIVSDGGDGAVAAGAFTTANLRQDGAVVGSSGAGRSILGSVRFNEGGGVNRQVVAPDGSIFIAGSFTSVNGQPRAGLARLSASGEVLPWAPTVSGGQVLALRLDGGRIAVGGSFTQLNGQAQARLGLLSVTDGKLDRTLRPNIPSGQVQDINFAGSTIYFAGTFAAVDGQARGGLAALDATTGDLRPWAPTATGGSVTHGGIQVRDRNVYLAGSFTHISGQARNDLARVDAITGQVDAWNPGTDGAVYQGALDGSTWYLVGYFNSVAGTVRYATAAIDLNTGALTGFVANTINASYWVGEVAAGPDGVYISGGPWTSINGTARTRVAKLNKTTGALDASWNPQPNGDVATPAASASGVALFRVSGASGFTQIAPQARSRLLRLDRGNGLTSWAPTTNGIVYTLDRSGDDIYLGGEFTQLNGDTAHRLGRVSLANPSSSRAFTGPQQPGSAVYELERAGDVIYAVGYYVDQVVQFPGSCAGSCASIARNYGHAVDRNGTLVAWNPQLNALGARLSSSGDTLYVTGNFTSAGGQARGYGAAWDIGASQTSPPLSTWNPQANGMPLCVAPSQNGATIFLGGQFTSLMGQSRANMGAIADGALTPWNPGPSPAGQTSRCSTTGDTLFTSHSTQTTIEGVAQPYTTAWNMTSNARSSWNPQVNNEAYTHYVPDGSSKMWIGGLFTSVGGQPAGYIAQVAAPTDVPTTPSPGWTDAAAMPEARAQFASEVLEDGKVLVAGGQSTGSPLSSARLYDPQANTWSPAGEMSAARLFTGDASVRLDDGRVLVAGGYTSTSPETATAASDLYASASNAWSTTGSMAIARYDHNLVKLGDGRVMAIGGASGGSALASAEVFDPQSGTWSPVPSMSTARKQASATLLPSGRVLVAGGFNGSYLSSSEVYDPATNAWTSAGSIPVAQMNGKFTLMNDGTVALVGGLTTSGATAATATFNGSTWTTRGSLNHARGPERHVTPTSNGSLLAVGGAGGTGPRSTVEAYSPTTPSWGLQPALTRAHARGAAHSLPNGRVIVIGGHTGDSLTGSTTAAVEYRSYGAWTAPAASADPVVSGPADVGQSVTADTGSWSNYPTRITTRWQRCNVSLTSCATIPDSASARYVITGADIGYRLRARVTAENPAGKNTTSSNATATVAASPYTSAVLASAPDAYYPMNEANGRVLRAAVGSDGGYYGGAQPGAAGASSSLGSAAQMTRPGHAEATIADMDARGETLEAWFYMPSTSTYGTVAYANGWGFGVGPMWGDGGSGNQIMLIMEGVRWVGTTSASPTTAAVGWHHGVMQIGNDGQPRFWLNGVELTLDSGAPAAAQSSSNLYIGGYGPSSTTCGGRCFDGRVDEVAFYKRQISPEEIAAHYNAAQHKLAAPTASVAPSISGSTFIGQEIAADDGSWLNSPTSVVRQWMRCDRTGANCVAIPGEVDSTYTMKVADTGKTIRLRVTARNPTGSTSTDSAPSTLVASRYAREVLADAPLSWWRLGEGTGATAVDVGSRGYNGTLGGNVLPNLGQSPLIADDNDRSFAFSGNNGTNYSQVNAGVNYGSEAGLAAVTLEAWIKTTNPGASFRGILTIPGDWGMFLVDGRLAVYDWASTNSLVTTPNLADGKHHHVAVSISGGEQRLYVDGVHVGTLAHHGRTPTSHNTLIGVGGLDASGQAINAFIDEPAFYGQALSGARIAAHYTAGLQSAPAAPAATSSPTLTGVASEGETLRSGAGQWNATTVAHERTWQRCDASGANCVDLDGTSGSQYDVSGDDVGSRLRVKVVAQNVTGSTTAYTPTSDVVLPREVPVGYAKDDRDIVHLRGIARVSDAHTTNSSDAILATLPAGHRPPKSVDLVGYVARAGGTKMHGATLRISPDGEIRYVDNFAQASSVQVGDAIVLDGLSFTASSSSLTYAAPTFRAQWGDRDTAIWSAAGAAVDSDGIAHLRGNIKSIAAWNATDNSIMTLPVAARPAERQIFTTACYDGGSRMCRLDILPSGDVYLMGNAPGGTFQSTVAGATGISLENISYRTTSGPTLNALTTTLDWSHWGAPYTVPGYSRDSRGIVYLQGLYKRTGSRTIFGTPSDVVAKLPVGALPAARQYHAVISADRPVGDGGVAHQVGQQGVTPGGNLRFESSSQPGNGIVTEAWIAADSTRYVARTSSLGFTNLTTTTKWGGTATPATPAAPSIQSAPRITGEPQTGVALDATDGAWANTPTSISHRWQSSVDGGSSWADIDGATSSQYIPAANMVGRHLRVAVTATNGAGTSTAYSSRTTAVVISSSTWANSGSATNANLSGFGSPLPAAGRWDTTSSLALSGASSDYATAPSFAFTGSSFTVEAWAQFAPGSTNGTLVAQGQANADRTFLLGASGGSMYCSFYASDAATPLVATDTDGTWHHWACTYDTATNTQTLYRDGVVKAQRTASVDPTPPGLLHIGVDPWYPAGTGRPLNGRVDDVALFSSALTPARIAAHAASAAAVAVDSPVRRYTFGD